MQKIIDRVSTIEVFRERQQAIEFDSPDDEGAAEHWAELQSIINALENEPDDAKVFNMADSLCEGHNVIFMDHDAIGSMSDFELVQAAMMGVTELMNHVHLHPEYPGDVSELLRIRSTINRIHAQLAKRLMN